MLGVVFVGSLAMLGGSAWMAQRGYRSCICCHPRRRFRTVAERRRHEQIGHSLGALPEPRVVLESIDDWRAQVECGGHVALMTDMEALEMADSWWWIAERIRAVSRIRATQRRVGT